MKSKRSKKNVPRPRGWDAHARWYDGMVGQKGSRHHRRLAIPALLALLDPQPGQAILDLGAGQGVLSTYIAHQGATYTGVDISPQMIRLARRRHAVHGRFLLADAAQLRRVPGLTAASFDAITFLLSIQDMPSLEGVIASAAWALKPGGRVVVLMTHPCFRIPRQSGWGWDQHRKLQYRRLDSYLSCLDVPMDPSPGQRRGLTRSYHRPLNVYVNLLSHNGLLLDQLRELPSTLQDHTVPHAKAKTRADREIPLFLALRAIKISAPRSAPGSHHKVE